MKIKFCTRFDANTECYNFFRNPKTHIRPDYDMFWDFLTLRQECTHTTLIFFSDRGIPESFRKMHGFGVNTYAFVNAEGKFNYCKFHWLSNQGKEKYKTHLNFFFSSGFTWNFILSGCFCDNSFVINLSSNMFQVSQL